MSSGKTLVIGLVVVVALLAVVKVGGAWLDINGMEADIESAAKDLPIDCAGSRSCGDKLVDAIEELREFHHRDVELDYDSLDVDAEQNVMTISGVKRIDFKVRVFVWRFTLRAQLPQ